LGCIDAAPIVNGPAPAIPKTIEKGFLTTKATLVIVPGHLMGQWPREIEKFLGKSKNVVLIKDMSGFNKLTVADIKKADIVVVSFTVLNGDSYFWRLARLAGANTESVRRGGGKMGGRHFDAVYNECLSRLTTRVDKLKDHCSTVFDDVEDDAYANAQRLSAGSKTAIRLDGKKSVYGSVSEEQSRKEAHSIPKEKDLEQPGKIDANSQHGKLRKDGVNDKLGKADRDPWGLFKQDSVEKMQCPPLELFFWNRLVVDEFHCKLVPLFIVSLDLVGHSNEAFGCCYSDLQEKKDRARVLSLVMGIKASFRWCLSGTPPHENVIDVQNLAKLLGVHLGVYDAALPGTKLKRRSIEESGLEKLSSFLEQRSLQWHECRHEVAQGFLDQFLRQNIAEIDEIKCEEKVSVALGVFVLVQNHLSTFTLFQVQRIELPSVERAIYLELETYLKSLEALKGKKSARVGLKSKKSVKGDREQRMQKILEDSDTPEEALIKRAAHFNSLNDETPSDDKTDTCGALILLREQQLKDCEDELLDSVVRAMRQRVRIMDLQPDWKGEKSNSKGEVQDRLAMFLLDVSNKQSVSGGADDEVHEKIISIIAEAEKVVAHSPRMYDSYFAEVNGDPKEDGPVEGDGRAGIGKKRKLHSPEPKSMKGDEESCERLYDKKYKLREFMHIARAQVS
jgi:hypothetical protein